ncbi:MAG: hypothetical protein KGO96_10565 [Elusimicrobia bacterium]|nr:hypothetical protein [Elusimicrobiota bacterium]
MQDTSGRLRRRASDRAQSAWEWVLLRLLPLCVFVLVVVAGAVWIAQSGTSADLVRLRISVGALDAQVQAIQAQRAAANEARRESDAALAAKLDTITTSLATVTAKLEDVRVATEKHRR